MNGGALVTSIVRRTWIPGVRYTELERVKWDEFVARARTDTNRHTGNI